MKTGKDFLYNHKRSEVSQETAVKCQECRFKKYSIQSNNDCDICFNVIGKRLLNGDTIDLYKKEVL
jgi:hypothetical protein